MITAFHAARGTSWNGWDEDQWTATLEERGPGRRGERQPRAQAVQCRPERGSRSGIHHRQFPMTVVPLT